MMNPTLKFKQWHPPEPKAERKPATSARSRDPRRTLSSKSMQPTLYDSVGFPTTAGWHDFVDVTPCEESRAIEDIIDQAMRSAAFGNTDGSFSMPNPVPVVQASPLHATHRAKFTAFPLSDERAYSADDGAQDIKAVETQPEQHVFGTSLRDTVASMTTPEPMTDLHLDLNLDLNLARGVPTAFQDQRGHTHFAWQTPPCPSIPGDEEMALSADSVSTSNESSRSPTSTEHGTGYSGDTVQTATSARSEASPLPVTTSVTEPGLRGLCHADRLDDRPRSSQSVTSTPPSTQEPGFVNTAARSLGTARASPASSVEDPDMDEVIRQISIATRSDASKSSAGSDPGHTLPPPSPATTVEPQYHSCDVPFHATSSCHADSTGPRDDLQQFSTGMGQCRELETASYDIKTEEAASPPSPHAPDAPSPSLGPGGFRRSRRTARRVTYYSNESDSSTDIDCASSQDIDEYSLAASAAGVEVDVSDEDEDERERPLRKRRKLSMPSTRAIGSGAARVERPHQAGTPSRGPRRPVKGRGHVRTTCNASPTSSGAPISDSDLGAMLTRCGGWSLENASLRCMAENGKPVFQLQFNLSPGLLHDRASSIASGRPNSPSVRATGKAHQSTSTRLRYTRSEDDLLLKLKAEEKLPWSEIRQRFCEVFPSRPMESLQVHYSTKVKHRERS